MPAIDGQEPVGGKERVVVVTGSADVERNGRQIERRERSRRRCDSYLNGRGPSVGVVSTSGRSRIYRRRPDQARYLSPLQHDELHHALRSTFLQRLRLLLRLSRLRAHRRRHRQVNNAQQPIPSLAQSVSLIAPHTHIPAESNDMRLLISPKLLGIVILLFFLPVFLLATINLLFWS